MEVESLSSAAVALEKMMVCCAMEAVVLETLLAAGRSLASILMIELRIFQSGSLMNAANASPELIGMDKRFPFEELHRRKQPDTENTDGSETEDDEDDDDEDDADDPEDDAGDEDFSGEEGEDDEGDPEDEPAANGDGGSDDDDDDDDDGDEDDDDDEEEEEEEEDEEIQQPPAKKRK